MNGRAILFSRCFIGLLAYFLCGLAYADFPPMGLLRAGFVTVSGSLPECIKINNGVNSRMKFISYNETVISYLCQYQDHLGDWSSSQNPYAFYCDFPGSPKPNAKINAVTLMCIKPECENKKGKNAGELDVPVPGAKIVNGEIVMTNRDTVVDFAKRGFPSCDGTCELKIDGSYNPESIRSDYSTGWAYVRINTKYTGEECKPLPDDKPPKPSPPGPSKDPAPKPPKGPSDCPAKTSFIELNGVKMCFKNAPLPTDPSPPPKPGDKDSCIGNCDKWDPDAPKPTDPKDPKPTDPKDPSTGGTTPATKGPLSSDASKPASENASGPADSSLAASCTDFKCKNKDPATCEIARLAWNNKCMEEKAAEDLIKTDLYKNGNAAMSGDGLEDMKKSLNFGENGTVDMAGVIKRDTFLNKGGLSDVSFTVMGKGFSLPFSSVNKYLSMMGKIAVAFSLLAAARILSAAV